MSSSSHPWKFEALPDITYEEIVELVKVLDGIHTSDCNTITSKLARHFKHEDTGERAKGANATVDPDQAYDRAMKVCG